MSERNPAELAFLYRRHKRNQKSRELAEAQERRDIKAEALAVAKSGMSFQKIAAAVGVSPTTISHWVGGKARVGK